MRFQILLFADFRFGCLLLCLKPAAFRILGFAARALGSFKRLAFLALWFSFSSARFSASLGGSPGVRLCAPAPVDRLEPALP